MASAAIKPPPHTSTSTLRWIRGMGYVVAVAVIWIAASFVVQSVEDTGVSPFLITYICNSLFIIYIPVVELRRFLERAMRERGWGRNVYGRLLDESEKTTELSQKRIAERETLLESETTGFAAKEERQNDKGQQVEVGAAVKQEVDNVEDASAVDNVEDSSAVRFWTRKRTAMVGLTICPFWFLAQLTFNLSLKFTTVTSNTILSTTSSLFTFLVSLQFLGERFTWVKLASVCLCMTGTILVSLGDSWTRNDASASRPLLGDFICLLSAIFYATYTAIIRVKIPDEDDENGSVSTALVFGYLGLFNAILVAPIAILLHVTGVEHFQRLTLSQVGLIIGKGLLDNVLSDYLWARAVLLTTPTAATAGLTIQVPIAALIDSLRGVIPSYMDIIGAVAVLIGFFGINQSDSKSPDIEELTEKVDSDSLDDPGAGNLSA